MVSAWAHNPFSFPMLPAFTSLGSAWLFLLIVPLMVFYFLKLRRPRVEISSLVLWRQVLSDQRVNSPFQKFKRNLLLLLQLLLLALLALAAMQPFLRRETGRAHRLPVLIDVSASMAALDKEGGISRLDEAKKKVRGLIENLLPDQQLCLVAFGKNARRLTAFTNNRRELTAALDSLATDDVPSDLEEALRMAQALGRNDAFDSVMLFSDGNFPARAQFELPFKIDFQRTAPGGSNFGIVACSARRPAGGGWEVFVQLAGSANAESTTATLEIVQDGHVAVSEKVPLAKGGSPRLAFQLASDRASVVEARLGIGGFDSLASDNSAWLALPAVRPLAVYVPERLASYRHALEAIEHLSIYPRKNQPSPGAYDLVITDSEEDLRLPSRVQCIIGLLPADVKKLVGIYSQNSQAIDWRRDSPLLQHVSLADVIFMDQPTLAGGSKDEDFARLGYEILAQGSRGPLILQKREGDVLRVNLLFHTDRSTLPWRVGFPVFVSNLVQTALQQAGLSEALAARTGVLPALNLAPDRAYRVDGPGGFHRTETSDASGQLTGIPALRAGDYVVSGEGTAPIHVGASLLSPSETSLAAVDQIEFDDRLTVSASASAPKSDLPLWRFLAGLGFVVLLIEWWFFQRPPHRARRSV